MSKTCIKCEKNSVSKKFSENAVLCDRCFLDSMAELYEEEPATDKDLIFARWLRGNISWEKCRDLTGGTRW